MKPNCKMSLIPSPMTAPCEAAVARSTKYLELFTVGSEVQCRYNMVMSYTERDILQLISIVPYPFMFASHPHTIDWTSCTR